MAQDDPRDVRTLASDLAEEKAKIDKLREQLRQSDTDARKVPSLTNEVERLEDELERGRVTVLELRETVSDLETQVSELESRLRDQDELENALSRANQRADDARADQERADQRLQDLQGEAGEKDNLIKQLTDKLNSANKVIAAAREDVETRDLLRTRLEQHS